MKSAGAQAISRLAGLAGALACLAVFVLLAALATMHFLDGVDQVARAFVRDSGPSSLRPFMEACSFWGGEAGQAVAVIFLAGLAFCLGRRRWALALPVVMAGSGLLQLLAKSAMARPRPNLEPWGFPSAHVLSLAVLAGCVAYFVRSCGVRRVWQQCSVGCCAALVTLVAYSRMYLDAHWFSDILGGLSIGAAYLLFVIWLDQRTIEPIASGLSATALVLDQDSQCEAQPPALSPGTETTVVATA